MRAATRGAFLLWLTVAVPEGAEQISQDESCPGVITAPPDLSVCFGPSAAGGEVGWLSGINCALRKVENFQFRQLRCLEGGVKRIETLRKYPEALLEPLVPIRDVVKEIATLRQQVASLSCGWQFSTRTELLKTLYLEPVRLCKVSLQRVFGSHSRFPDADLHEYLDWTSVVTRNLVAERTVGEPGLVLAPGKTPEGPEFTWQRIAAGAARGLATDAATPGEAIRMGAALSADTARVKTSTIQIRAQAALVEQQRRDYSARLRQLDKTLHFWVLRGIQARGQ
ncbi:MAG TPA: hypothetical protein VKI41_06615 [Vicinamibacteria bacterium]|nr:hypothetical protein [Vicinamibacteria bacterium]